MLSTITISTQQFILLARDTLIRGTGTDTSQITHTPRLEKGGTNASSLRIEPTMTIKGHALFTAVQGCWAIGHCMVLSSTMTRAQSRVAKGSTHAVCVWKDQSGRVNSPPHHYSHSPQFGVKLVSHPQSPPSASPLSTRHNCVISSKERKFSLPILSRSAFPRSCIKFVFPTHPRF